MNSGHAGVRFECVKCLAGKNRAGCAGDSEGEVQASPVPSNDLRPRAAIHSLRKASIHSSIETTCASEYLQFVLACSQYFLSSESPVTKTSQ